MPPALYAHRLGRAYGPDSSRAALARTLERPPDGLETDCCLTADGQLVLLHDPLLELGSTASGWAHERSAAEILGARLRDRSGAPSAESPMLLGELLALVPGELALQVEVKAHADPQLARRTARALCELLAQEGAGERVEVISFWSGACEVAAELGFRARLVMVADYCGPALAAWAQRSGVGGVAVAHSMLSHELVGALRERGRSVSAFTINDRVALERALAVGLDAVTSDDPHALRELLDGERG